MDPPIRNRRVEEQLRAAVDHLDQAILEGSRPMVDAQQDTRQPAADSRGEMAERQANPAEPMSRAQAGLERVIAALAEELRKTKEKRNAAKLRKEWTSQQALQSAIATLEYRLETARKFLRQAAAASEFTAKVEKDLSRII